MFKRRAPRWVQQTGVTCWAAALESWLEATPGRPTLGRAELIKRYSTRPDGALDPVRVGLLSQDLGMGYNIFTFSNSRPGNPAVDPRLIESLLKDRGHIYLVYAVTPTWTHANVVYGVENPPKGWTMLNVMDPDPHGGLTARPLSHFFGMQDHVILGWPGF